jgi:phage baseplate assembly protein W
MSTLEKKLYQEVEVKSNKRPTPPTTSRAYRGISTANPENTSFNLYDIALIKQDIINHFHIRRGEKLENPTFGTIIWDVLFDPLTEELRAEISDDVTAIINYDPRVQVNNIIISAYESGIQIECDLTYLPYSISERLRFQFDQDNNILS